MPNLKFFVALILTFSLQSTFAGELRLDYSSFYSHLKKLNNEELAPLEFAFGFLNVRSGDLCHVDSVMIHTDKKDIDISVAKKRFVLPSEKALKLAKAEVHVKLQEQNNQCDLSVQLQIKPTLLEDGVDKAELAGFFQAFEDFFDKMGGFLSFMMPSPSGMYLQFQPDTLETGMLASWLQPQEKAQQYLVLQGNLPKLPDDLLLKDISAVTAYVAK